jgi:hypothetical protein
MVWRLALSGITKDNKTKGTVLRSGKLPDLNCLAVAPNARQLPDAYIRSGVVRIMYIQHETASTIYHASGHGIIEQHNTRPRAMPSG